MNKRYIWDKFMLMVMLIEAIVLFVMTGFYAGQIYIVRNAEVSFRNGIVFIEVDGRQYIHFVDDYVQTSFE